MNRLVIFAFCFLLSAFALEAQQIIPKRGPAFQPAAAVVSACGVLFCENFEDATYGYDSHNANGWTTNSGTAITPNNTAAPAPLAGTQSLLVDNRGGATTISVSFTAQSELYGFFEYLESADFSGLENVLSFNTSGGTHVLLFSSQSIDFGISGTAVAPFARTTHYYIWFHYVKGTGADGVFEIYSSTTSTKPGSPGASTSSGSWTSQLGQLSIGLDTSGNKLHLDRIRLSTSNIGSNPP